MVIDENKRAYYLQLHMVCFNSYYLSFEVPIFFSTSFNQLY